MENVCEKEWDLLYFRDQLIILFFQEIHQMAQRKLIRAVKRTGSAPLTPDTGSTPLALT